MAEKRGTKRDLAAKTRESSSPTFLQDNEFNLLKTVLTSLQKKYNLSAAEIISAVKDEILIPATIFVKGLSPLEAVVKYLKENKGLGYPKISELLGRDSKTIWQAYKNAVKSYSSVIEPVQTPYAIPVSAFKTDLSILEAAVSYLKENFNLSYHIIGQILQRNERTIWTVYNRAQKKRENAKA